MTTVSHDSVIRALLAEGWNSHDTSKVLSHYHDPVSFRSPLAGELTSLAELERFAGGLFRAFPDARMEPTQVISVGPNAFVHFKATGTNTGPLPDGTPPTGKSMRFEGLAHTVIEDGKLRQDWVYYDALGLLRQLGLAPQR